MKRLAIYGKDLERLAMMIGRRGEDEIEAGGKFQRAAKSDITGITIGGEIGCALPSEITLLTSSATENIFYDRLVRKKLQVFASASKSKGIRKKEEGPVYICIDTSSSMRGEPEKMAKALALSVAEIAQTTNRPVCLINYSDDVSFFVLTNLERQRRHFMKFLTMSYGGGNDEENLFDFIFNVMPQLKDYKKFGSKFEGADLLVVSDFFWTPLTSKVKKLLEKSRKGGMRFFALGVGNKEIFTRNENNNGFCAYGGLGFFHECDARFVYDDGWCTEVKTRSQHQHPSDKEYLKL